MKKKGSALIRDDRRRPKDPAKEEQAEWMNFLISMEKFVAFLAWVKNVHPEIIAEYLRLGILPEK
jgi:hypothetical protein